MMVKSNRPGSAEKERFTLTPRQRANLELMLLKLEIKNQVSKAG